MGGTGMGRDRVQFLLFFSFFSSFFLLSFCCWEYLVGDMVNHGRSHIFKEAILGAASLRKRRSNCTYYSSVFEILWLGSNEKLLEGSALSRTEKRE